MFKEKDLSFTLLNVLKKLQRLSVKEYLFEDLNVNDLIVCKIIIKNKEDNKLTQAKDLSEYMNISRPAVNTILNRLEDKELIERKRIKEDRRGVYLYLTDKANTIYKNELMKFNNFIDKIINTIGMDKSIILIELLNEVYNIMEDEVRKNVEAKKY